MKSCNALDYLVGKSIKIDIESREDGVYLQGGERWQPSVNWAQCGPLINSHKIHLSGIIDRHEPHAASTRFIDWIKKGETQQVAICNLVVALSNLSEDERKKCPYKPVTTIGVRIREGEFKKKYPIFEIDDMYRIDEINKIGVEKYIQNAIEIDKSYSGPLKEWCCAESDAKRLVSFCSEFHPELIEVGAYEKK